MSTQSTKQSGFSAVLSIVAVVLVIGVLGVIGWRLYNQPSAKTNDATSNNQTTSKTPVNNPNPTPTTPQLTYLDIKELGIKIQLDDSIKDAIYSAHTSSDGSQYANISTQTLSDKSNGDCGVGVNGTPIAKVMKVSGTNRTVDNINTFKVGNNYFVIAGPQGTCSTDQTVLNLAGQQKDTFFNDFKTVQLDQ